MTPEEVKMFSPLIDLQPVYNVVVSGVCANEEYPEVAAYARWQLQRMKEALQAAAKYIREYQATLSDGGDE